MKLRSVRYLTAEGFKNIWVNRLMSIASIGVLSACMLLMGFTLSLSMNVDEAMTDLENQNVVMVYVKDSYTREQAQALKKKIGGLSNVKETVFITREEGAERMKTQLGEYADLFAWLKKNPLPDSVQVTFKDLNEFEKTLKTISAMEGVESVRDRRDIVKLMTGIRKAINTAGFWIIGLLVVISLVIIANTIRITMHNRRREIGIMRAVGATSGFIRFPFLVEGILLGILSSCIAVVLLYFLYSTVMDALLANIPQDLVSFRTVAFRQFAFRIFGIFLGIGAVAGLLGSSFSITKYLRREGSAISGN